GSGLTTWARRGTRPTSMTTTAAPAASPRAQVRDRWGPERRPAGRRLRRRGDQPVAGAPSGQHDPHAAQRGRRGGQRVAGRHQTWDTWATHSSTPLTSLSQPGNIRVDYVLPSTSLRILDSGVFWPVSSDLLSALTGTCPFPSSDYRLVWVDVHLPH